MVTPRLRFRWSGRCTWSTAKPARMADAIATTRSGQDGWRIKYKVYEIMFTKGDVFGLIEKAPVNAMEQPIPASDKGCRDSGQVATN